MLAPQLPYAGLDPAEFPQDDLPFGCTIRGPFALAFQGIKNEIESLLQVGQYAIMIERRSMSSMQRGGGAADEDGVGHQLLQPRRRFQDLHHIARHSRGLARSS